MATEPEEDNYEDESELGIEDASEDMKEGEAKNLGNICENYEH